MTKAQIDEYITTNYTKLKIAAANIKKNTKKERKWDVEELISYMYNHLLKNMDILNDSNIESFCINYINKNTKWEKSDINYIYRDHRLTYVEKTNDNIIEEEYELEEKIRLELIFNHQLAIASLYRQTLQPHQRIIFDAIYKENITKIKDLVAKFGINRTYMSKQKKEINENFKLFVQNYN
jgi:hypothetical protein